MFVGVAIIALLLTTNGGPASAIGPASNSMVDTGSGAMSVDCDASAVGIQSNCTYSTGDTFSVQVHVTDAPKIGYFAFQTKLRWSETQVHYLPAAVSADEALWPDCAIAARFDNSQAEPPDSSMLFFCNPTPLSTPDLFFTGAILEFQFQCEQNGSSPLMLVPRAGDNQQGTHFLDTNIAFIDPLLASATVACVGVDSDGDGCTDEQELGLDAALGGQRDPNNFWDFFDVPTGTPPERDGAITAGDISAVATRFGETWDPALTASEALAEALTEPPATGYHAAFDRSPPSGDPWDAGPPEGAISEGDITAVVIQFGHTCL